MALAAFATAFIMFVWKFTLDSEIEQTEQNRNRVQQQLTNAQSKLQLLQAELVKHNDKAVFNQTKQQLEARLRAKRVLLESVGASLESNTINYHSVLDELTKYHDSNIWLSYFSVDEHQMSFTGFALNSSSVTRWMTKLQSASTFKGREFNLVSIKSHDQQTLSFVIATSLETDDEEQAQSSVSQNISELSIPQLIEEASNE